MEAGKKSAGQELSPLERVIEKLQAVAEGGSAADLRATVWDVFPKDPMKAKGFLNVLNRLKDAAEAAAQTGNDAYADVTK